ncbi:hypothetical protein CDAR_97971 [Caerostris darwini]|uniref:Uncharacterized protein n=1 Tax=Caerostris darwini TaxID=1538125 RepID=A0AAV4SK09_9ARAC|nr:hypothetical protein CDAR_97971 [Caerostris darwini]
MVKAFQAEIRPTHVLGGSSGYGVAIRPPWWGEVPRLPGQHWCTACEPGVSMVLSWGCCRNTVHLSRVPSDWAIKHFDITRANDQFTVTNVASGLDRELF